MSVEGWNSPSTAADDSAVGTITWSDPNNIKTSNDANASTAMGVGTPSTSHYVKGTNFGFTLTGTVDGVEVDIERAATFGGIWDRYVQLAKASTVQGANKADQSTVWGSIEATIGYGGAADLWSLTLSDSDVQNSGFGAAIAVEQKNAYQYREADVDHIQIRITYTPGAAGGSLPPVSPIRPALRHLLNR